MQPCFQIPFLWYIFFVFAKIRKTTVLTLAPKHFSMEKKVSWGTLSVGFPAALSVLLVSVSISLLNGLLLNHEGGNIITTRWSSGVCKIPEAQFPTRSRAMYREKTRKGLTGTLRLLSFGVIIKKTKGKTMIPNISMERKGGGWECGWSMLSGSTAWGRTSSAR